MLIPGTHTLKIGVSVIILAVAAFMWFWSNSDREYDAETAEALRGVIYRLRCNSCDHAFEMPAEDYLDDVGAEGVRCPKCGQYKAWRTGSASEVDPAQFREEMALLASIQEVSDAALTVQSEIDRVQDQISATEAAGNDASKLEELREELARLKARSTAIYARWEELARG